MEKRDGSYRTVLVVEDDESVRTLLATVLIRAGYSVVLSEDGRAGLEQLEARHPDLILLDEVMPMDGWQVLAALPAETAPPIIFMSTRIERASDPRLARVGFLHKPFTVRDVLERCAEWLGRAPERS